MYLKNHFEQSATHNYIFGVEHNGKVSAYMIGLDYDGFKLMFSDKPTESKRCTIVKYRSSAKKISYLELNATQRIEIGSIEYLKAMRRTRVNRFGKEYVENCGECFEWLLAERFGVKQNEKANLKFTDGGDLEINGVSYQVKYERAGITVAL